MTTEFKKGCRVRINDLSHPEKHGKEGEITLLAVNGAMVVFPSGMGTMVKFEHLEHV